MFSLRWAVTGVMSLIETSHVVDSLLDAVIIKDLQACYSYVLAFVLIVIQGRRKHFRIGMAKIIPFPSLSPSPPLSSPSLPLPSPSPSSSLPLPSPSLPSPFPYK